jgi:hypothetical protein
VESLAGGLDRTARRDLTDPGKWWEGSGFRTDKLEAVKSGNYRSKLSTPLSSVLQGHFERGAMYYMAGEFAYWDPGDFDLFGLFADSLSPAAWGSRFEFKLAADFDSFWTEILTLGKIYRITLTSPPVSPEFVIGELALCAAPLWTGVVIDFDAATGEIWIGKFSGAAGNNPANGQTIVGDVASETIDTVTDTGCVRIQFATPYAIADFGSATARDSAGAYPRKTPVLRRLAGARHATDDIYEHETLPTQLIHSFEEIDGVRLLVGTAQQTYLADLATPGATTEADCLNPTYSFANAVTAAGSRDVTGVGTDWTDTDWPGPPGPEWLFKVDADPDTAWTPVLSVGGATALTLRFPYPITHGGFGAPYTLRRVWQANVPPAQARLARGRMCNWLDGSPERLTIQTDGVSPIRKWRTGIAAVGNAQVGEFQPLAMTGLSTPMDWARIVRPWKEHLLAIYTKEGANTYPRRVRLSDRGNCEAWSDARFRDLPVAGTIEAAEELNDLMVVATTEAIVNLRYLGAPFYLGIQGRAPVGCKAGGSMVNIRNETLVYLGPDDLYSYDGIRPVKIGAPIRDFIFETLNDAARAMIAAEFDEITGTYYLTTPESSSTLRNRFTWAYDVDRRIWSGPFSGFGCFGRSLLEDAGGFVDDDDRIVDSVDDLVDARDTVSAPVFLAGGYDGAVHRLYDGSSADGADVDAYFTTGFADCGTKALKRFRRVTIEGRSTFPCALYVLLSQDGSRYTRVGPYTLRFDEDSPGSPLVRRDRTVFINKSAKFIALEIRHDRADDAVAISSAEFYFKVRGPR